MELRVIKLTKQDSEKIINELTEKCPTCELIETGGMFVDAECLKHPNRFQ